MAEVVEPAIGAIAGTVILAPGLAFAVPLEDRDELAGRLHLLQMRPKRVMLDESLGALDFGHCFPGGAHAYIAFPTGEQRRSLQASP